MNRKLLFFVLLISLIFVSPALAQDTELNATYTSNNGELTVSYPDGWEIDDQNTDIYFSPDIDDVEIVFRLLNELVQNTLGITHEMTAQEAMQTFIQAIPVDPPLTDDDISLSEHGENSVATIELILGEYTLASIVETSGGLVMVQAVGTEESVDTARDIYFDMIATTVFSLSEDIDEADEIMDESTGEIVLSEEFTSDDGSLSFSYPENWNLVVEDFTSLLTPIDATDDDNLQIQFIPIVGLVQSTLGIESDMNGEEAMTQIISFLNVSDNASDFILDEISGSTVVSVSLEYAGEFYISTIFETENGLMLAELKGTRDTVSNTETLYFTMLETVEYSPVEPISEDEVSIALDDSFTDKASGLSFSYPDGWDAENSFGGTNLSPDGDEFEDIEDVTFLFLMIDEDAEEQIGINVNMGAEEAMQLIVDSDDENDLTYDDIVLATYGENFVATVELDSSFGYVLASIVETSGGIVMVQLIGDEDEVDLARNIYFDIVASIVLSGNNPSNSDDSGLSETYKSENDELSFDYPDGWEIDDNDTEISILNDGISAEIEFNFWTEEVEETFGIDSNVQAGDAAITIAGFVEAGGLEPELDKITIGDYLVATVTFVDSDVVFTSAFVQTDAGVIMVRLEVEEDDLDSVSEIFEAMIASIDYHP